MPTFQIYICDHDSYDSDDGMPYEVPDLTMENYLDWSSRVLWTLRWSHGNLWPIVSGQESAPESDDDAAAFEQRQRLAMIMLGQCIPDVMRYFYDVNTDYDADPNVYNKHLEFFTTAMN
jgi:hypothetical protein